MGIIVPSLLVNEGNCQVRTKEPYFIRQFGQLNISNINHISKDTNGFVWLSSQSGVHRFDGRTLKRFELIRGKDSLSNTASSRMVICNPANNQVLAAFPNFGIAILNTTFERSYFQVLDIPGFNSQGKLTVQQYDKYYLASNTNGFCLFTVTKNKATDLFETRLLQHVKNINISAICKLSANQFAICETNGNLTINELQNGNKLNCIQSVKLNFVNKAAFESFCFSYTAGLYYLGTNEGLYQFSIKKDSASVENLFLPGEPIYNIAPVNDTMAYIAGDEALYELKNKTNLSEIRTNTLQTDNPFLSTVYYVFPDANKTWLGSQEGLAFFDQKKNPFYNINSTGINNFKPNHVYHIGTDKENNVILSAENGLYRYNETEGITNLKQGGSYFLAATMPDGNQIVSGINKTYVIKNNEFISIEKIYPEFKGFQQLSFNDYEYLSPHEVMLSTENEYGVFIWNFKNKTLTRLETYLNVPIVINQTNNLFKNNDEVFILTDDCVWKFSTNSLKRIPLKKSTKDFGIFFDMIKVATNYYFASYDNGVIMTDSSFNVTKIFDTKTGLSDNGVYRLHSVGDSILIVSSNNGLNVLHLKTGKIRHFTTNEGLHDNLFEEFSSLSKDGKIYFGGKNGFTIVDPKDLQFELADNNLRFLECRTTDEKNNSETFNLEESGSLTIPNTITQTTISFENIIYPHGAGIKFSYFIKELQQSWTDLGTTNFISLIGLSPGTYHLKVKTSNEDGVWSESKELILIYLPKWYQTLLFKILVGLFIAGFIYALYRYRIEQVRKQERMRKQISADLHDDIGGTLSSINVFSHLAISNPGKMEYLVNINEGTQAAVMGIRDIVWVLDDRLDSVADLVGRFMQFARPLATANKILLEQKIDPQLLHHSLSKNEKRNIYLILKEAFNNCIKYSGCNNFSYTIDVVNAKKIRVIIKDNGRGFEISKSQTGNGLKNMQDRSAQIGYEYIIESSENKGTTIQLIKR